MNTHPSIIGDDDNLFDADIPWNFEPVGYCAVFYRELPNPENPEAPLREFQVLQHAVGDDAPEAPLKKRLAHYMSTQCPADKYQRRATQDQLIQWVKMRSNYGAIARCFIALDYDHDPLKASLEDPEDPMEQWDYQQFWTSAKMFQILYEVLTEKWESLSRVSKEFAENEPKYAFPGDTAYDFYTSLLSEVSNSEMERYFQKHFDDRPYPFGRFATLLRRQIGQTQERSGQEKRELTPEEFAEVDALFLDYAYDGDALFARFQRIWDTLAKQDPWLAEKFDEYRALVGERLKGERDVFYQSELKHHRPSATWFDGNKYSNKRDDDEKPWKG